MSLIRLSARFHGGEVHRGLDGPVWRRPPLDSRQEELENLEEGVQRGVDAVDGQVEILVARSRFYGDRPGAHRVCLHRDYPPRTGF